MKDRVENIFVLLITIGFLLACLSPASAQGPIICPSGYQYNASQGKCVSQQPPTSCPQGYQLSADKKSCILNPASLPSPLCGEFFSYNPAIGLCRPSGAAPQPDCGAGYQFDKTIKGCKFAGTPPQPTCPQGFVYDSKSLKCKPTTTPPQPHCGAGWRFDRTIKGCKVASTLPQPTCPQHFVYASYGACSARSGPSPYCPSGYLLHSEQKKYLCKPRSSSSPPDPTCPSDFQFNREQKVCIATLMPICSGNLRWDPAQKRCVPKQI